MHDKLVEQNLEFILEGIALNKSAGTLSDELALKGCPLNPTRINKYLKANGITRARPNLAKRFISCTSGCGEDGIVKGKVELACTYRRF